MVITIPVEKAITEKNAIFIDTRTPQEFEKDCIPWAINIPIFSNEERAVVGTMYKQVSKEKAIEVGIEFFAQKMPDFMKQISRYKNKELIIYCWRGGMRSQTIVSLLESLGYKVQQLEGGYKQYRAYINEKLDHYIFTPKIFVLWGLTCTGKTQLLQQFPNAMDLEGLAQHRGSIYGSVGLTPRSQKKFENFLYWELERLKHEKYIMVEGESRKIGQVQIPLFFYQLMLKGTPVLIKRSLDSRAKLAVTEYFKNQDNIQKITEITQRMQKIISHQNREKVLHALSTQQYQEAAKVLLEFYYDPLYQHTLKKMKFAFEIEHEDIRKATLELKQKINQNI